jgi:FAD/FMN-containing dehydrogenase
MLIEDVACPVDKLADMIIDLIEMFQRYGYQDASCFGHALEGNLHLVFAQVKGVGSLGAQGGAEAEHCERNDVASKRLLKSTVRVSGGLAGVR